MVQFTFPSIYAGSQGLTWLWSPSLQDNTPTLNKKGIFTSVFFCCLLLLRCRTNSSAANFPPIQSINSDIFSQVVATYWRLGGGPTWWPSVFIVNNKRKHFWPIMKRRSPNLINLMDLSSRYGNSKKTFLKIIEDFLVFCVECNFYCRQVYLNWK